MEQRSGMVEKRGMGLWLTHGFMITGVLIISDLVGLCCINRDAT